MFWKASAHSSGLLPRPDVATFTLPGLSLMYLISSCTELTGTCALTTSAICTCVVTVTGLKSVSA